MENRYVVFDVETPNHSNDAMSAIGVTVVEGGEIVEEYDFFVNPETHFDAFNISLTGITPEMVAHAPNFAAVWEELEPVFSSGILIAHNAPFDMSVLAKCLRRYDIFWKPTVSYGCTCRMGRACLPQLPDHKLNTMCRCLGIALQHHNAASDSHACAELLCFYLHHGLRARRFVHTYDLLHCRALR